MTFYVDIYNSIYIMSLEDYKERRAHQNRAIGYYNRLKQELLYVSKCMPSKINLNKYMRSIDLIDKEIGLIKLWRKSDNKIKEKLG